MGNFFFFRSAKASRVFVNFHVSIFSITGAFSFVLEIMGSIADHLTGNNVVKMAH